MTPSCGAMMSDFDTTRALLKDDAVAPAICRTGYSRRVVTLEERDNQRYTLIVTGVPDEVVAFKTDMFPPPNRIFKDSRSECKRADYVIIARNEARSWIIYIEMKSGAGNVTEIRAQLRGAKCVVAYCRAIVREFWGDDGFLRGYRERFVSVRYIGINKRPTRVARRRVHDNPNDMLKLTAPKGMIPFKKLL